VDPPAELLPPALVAPPADVAPPAEVAPPELVVPPVALLPPELVVPPEEVTPPELVVPPEAFDEPPAALPPEPPLLVLVQLAIAMVRMADPSSSLHARPTDSDTCLPVRIRGAWSRRHRRVKDTTHVEK